MIANWMRPLFVVAGLYDGLLGLAFLICAPRIFNSFGVTPPNHFGYVQFPALLLIIFAIMFFRIAQNPVGNRDLIFYGIALKLSYCGVAFWHHLHGGIPFMFVPWAWADLVFLLLFLLAWKQTGPGERALH